MAKKIIILKTLKKPKPNITAVFWLDVPTPNQPRYANALFESQFKEVSGPELTDLQSGIIVEIVETHEFETGVTPGVVKSALIERFNILQNEVTNETAYAYYGLSWNGSTWG